ncbi:hypothetical protein [Jannaschia pohangensis]|uniref:Uncharacterized protein n=1 Tax=Jannaschia pohangensis TaxID=390807 RepID=A0A1I3V1E4_9RHOB|nr:hypothetical protein [Jannaschia pohangensis]SFJ88960.1 hypothetical protein SAMN04488095_0060 [Jannaschia pohangensis]
MTDALREKLARLARTDEEWTVTGRVLAAPEGATRESLLQALLDEIDDTVLTARLVFGYGGEGPRSGRLTVIAGGRRLRGILAATDELGADPDLLGRALDAETDADAGTVGALFDRFVAGALQAVAPITVIATPRPEGAGADLSEGGIGVRQLAAAWDLEADDPGIPDITRLLTRCGADLTASLMRNADGTETAEPDAPAEIAATLGDLVARADSGKDAAAPTLTIWLPHMGSTAPALGLARGAQGGRLAMAFAPGNLAKIQTAWVRITRKS